MANERGLQGNTKIELEQGTKRECRRDGRVGCNAVTSPNGRLPSPTVPWEEGEKQEGGLEKAKNLLIKKKGTWGAGRSRKSIFSRKMGGGDGRGVHRRRQGNRQKGGGSEGKNRKRKGNQKRVKVNQARGIPTFQI